MELERKTEIQIDQERIERTEKIAQRRQKLANEQQKTFKTLEKIQKTGEETEEIDDLNDAIQVLKDLKNEISDTFNKVVEQLDTVIDDGSEEVLAKIAMEKLKMELESLENQLKLVQEKGAKVEEFGGVVDVPEVISTAKEWILFFSKKILDSEKRQNIRKQYEEMNENLKFMKDYGDDPMQTKMLEDVVQQLKKQVDNMKPNHWAEKDVDNFRIVMDGLFDGIDEISFIGTNLSEAIHELTSGSSGMNMLE